MSSTRERILAAAQSLYLRHGEERVTMRRVATEVGLTATALYRHFENREALLAEVVSDGFRVFGGYLYRSLEGSTPQERLRLCGAAYLRFAQEQREVYRTLFMSRPAAAATEKEREDARRAATFRFLVDRVEECLAADLLVEGDAEAIAVTIWAHVHGLVSLHIGGALHEDAEAFRRTYEESLVRVFRGLAKGPM